MLIRKANFEDLTLQWTEMDLNATITESVDAFAVNSNRILQQEVEIDITYKYMKAILGQA